MRTCLVSSLAFSWFFRGLGRPCFCLMRGYVSPMRSRCDYVWVHLRIIGVIVCLGTFACLLFGPSRTSLCGPTTFSSLPYLPLHTYT